MSSSNELKRRLAGAQETGEKVATLKALGAALLVEGNAADAGRAFGAAVALAPDDAEAVSGVRRALVASSRFAEALQWYRRELALAADDDVHRARLFKQMGDLFRNELRDMDNAQRSYARARQLDPRAFTTSDEPTTTPATSTPTSTPTPTPTPTTTTTTPKTPTRTTPAPKSAPSRPPAAPPPAEVPQAQKSWSTGPWRTVAVVVAGVLAAGLTVGYGVHFATPSAQRLAPPEASVPACPEPTTLAIVEQDGAAQRVVYQCAGSARTRRWTMVAGKRVELAMFVEGVPEGPVVLTPEPGLRIEGQHQRGLRSGTWLEFRDGVLVKVEEWSEGQSLQSRGQAVDGGGQPSDAGRAGEEPTDAAPEGPRVEELFAGMTARGWRVRIAEVRATTQTDPSLTALWALTLRRARLAGLRVDDNGRLEEPSK